MKTAIYIVVALLVSCTSDVPELSPLFGTDSGLVELQWGDTMVSAAPKMERIPGITPLLDTVVVVTDEPVYISPDSVVPPRIGDLTYAQFRFSGGSFLGYDVDRWHLWFSEEGKLRIVDIVFTSELPHDEIYDALGDKLLMIYGIPERGGMVWKKYRSRNWTERFVAGEEPETGALLTWGKIPGRVTITYHDLAYADSLDAIEYGQPVSTAEWGAREGRR